MWRRSVHNLRTMIINKFYIVTLLDFLVAPAMLLVSAGDLLLEGVDLLELFVHFLKIVVHLDVLEQRQTEVLIC